MAEEGKGIALVILGVVAIIAVVGLVLLFTNTSSTGALFTRASGQADACPYTAPVGESQYAFVGTGNAEENQRECARWVAAGAECIPTVGGDEFGNTGCCCRHEQNLLPLRQRGDVPLSTRQPSGVPASQESPGRIGP